MSKWKCTGYTNNHKHSFTIGKVYELNDRTDEMQGDDRAVYGMCGIHNPTGGTIAFLRRCGVIFEEVKDMFTKNDLKTGMFAETRNGEKWFVLRDSIYGDQLVSLEDRDTRVHDAIGFKHINDDLTCSIEDDNSYDIVLVVSPMRYPDLGSPDAELRTAARVYEREEVKELTVAEIEKLLGYKVKVVSEEEK